MSLTASDTGGGDFELVPEDIYTARCYRILDMGTQKGAEIFGSKEQHKVMLSWEFIGKDDARMTEGDNKGKPFSIHKTYTMSLGEKATLRQHLESWRGRKFTAEELKGFDLSKVLGQYCTIQVVHSEDGKYANIQTIMAYKGDKPEPVNTDLVFDIDNPDMQIFETLSDNVKGKIMQAPEWKQPVQVEEKLDDIVPVDDDEPVNLDDIPF